MGEELGFDFSLEEKEKKDYDELAARIIKELKTEFQKQPTSRRSLIVYKSRHSGAVRQSQYQSKKMF